MCVRREHQPLVADFLVACFEARGDERTRRKCLEMLERYGTQSHVPALEGYATNNLLGE